MNLNNKVLGRSFFEGPTPQVAEALLGKTLIRQWRGSDIEMLITETEAYDGFEDKASHAHRGKTARNHVMFGPAGVWYVYFTYGMHWMLNISAGPEEYPAAVLLRGAGDIVGPARLTKQLHITKAQNKKPAQPASNLWIEDRSIIVPKREIERTPRIGIRYAAEWVDAPYRFVWNKKK